MRRQSPALSRAYPSASGYVYTPPSPLSISVDNCFSRPGFGERFSYCRYTTNPYSTTYYAYNPNMSILEDGRSSNVDNRFSVYLAKMAVQPRYGFNMERSREVNTRDREPDDIDHPIPSKEIRSSSNQSALSKYWMTPRYWESERQKARQKAHNWSRYQWRGYQNIWLVITGIFFKCRKFSRNS